METAAVPEKLEIHSTFVSSTAWEDFNGHEMIVAEIYANTLPTKQTML